MQTRQFFALLFGSIGMVLFLGMGCFGAYRYWQFSGPVEHVSGTIEQLNIRHGRSTSYHASFRYAGPDGVNYENTSTVPLSVWNTFRVGDPVPVKFLPLQPNIARIDLPAADRLELINLIIEFLGGGTMLIIVLSRGLRPAR